MAVVECVAPELNLQVEAAADPVDLEGSLIEESADPSGMYKVKVGQDNKIMGDYGTLLRRQIIAGFTSNMCISMQSISNCICGF